MAGKAALASKAKGMGSASAAAIPERNDELSGGDNGLVADERRPTTKAGVIWKEDVQGKPALSGKASRKTIGATRAAADDGGHGQRSQLTTEETITSEGTTTYNCYFHN